MNSIPRGRPSSDASAWVNHIGTALPAHDVHQTFRDFARGQLGARAKPVFDRMADRSGITHRWSVLPPAQSGQASVDADGFYAHGSFPTTAARMRRYEAEAPELGVRAVRALELQADALDGITHLVVASCTGFTAPGLDQVLAGGWGSARTCGAVSSASWDATPRYPPFVWRRTPCGPIRPHGCWWSRWNYAPCTAADQRPGKRVDLPAVRRRRGGGACHRRTRRHPARRLPLRHHP